MLLRHQISRSQSEGQRSTNNEKSLVNVYFYIPSNIEHACEIKMLKLFAVQWENEIRIHFTLLLIRLFAWILGNHATILKQKKIEWQLFETGNRVDWECFVRYFSRMKSLWKLLLFTAKRFPRLLYLSWVFKTLHAKIGFHIFLLLLFKFTFCR